MSARRVVAALFFVLLSIDATAAKRHAAGCGGCINPNPQVPLPNLGSLAFTLDPANSVTFHAEADTARSASVSTSDGTKWTLVVPEGALVAPADITITAFRDVHATSGGVEPLSGVLLQPSGIEFALPVTLVAASEDGAAFDLITMNNDGSEVEPVLRDSGGAALLFHFSGASKTKPISDALLGALRGGFDSSVDAVINDNSKPPFPDRIPEFANCKKVDQAEISAYLNRFFNPEENLIVGILTGRILANQPAALTKAQKLLDRLANGAEMAILSLEGHQDFGVNSIDTAVQIVAKVDSLSERIRAQNFSGESQLVHEMNDEYKFWLSQIVDREIEKVRSQHDFKVIRRVEFATEQLRRTGQQGDWEDRLKKALQWTLKFNWTMGDETHLAIVATSPETPLVTGTFGGCSNTNTQCRGGTGTADFNGFLQNENVTGMPQQTTFNYSMRLDDYDGCAGTATIFIDILEPSNDEWEICPRKTPNDCNPNALHHVGDPPITQKAFVHDYFPNATTRGFIFDELPFVNGQELNIKTTVPSDDYHFDNPSVTAKILLNFELTHTPQP